jgi:hypothetical protein
MPRTDTASPQAKLLGYLLPCDTGSALPLFEGGLQEGVSVERSRIRISERATGKVSHYYCNDSIVLEKRPFLVKFFDESLQTLLPIPSEEAKP